MITTEIKLVFNDLPKIPPELRAEAAEQVRRTALSIEGRAKVNATPSVDTGAMRASIYTITDQGSTYGAAIAKAKEEFTMSAGRSAFRSAKKGKKNKARKAAKARADASFAANPEAAKPASDLSAIVGVGMEYGPYVEYGTARAPAQPFMTPAAEAATPDFMTGMRRVIRHGRNV